eukprot:351937-Chlamydomonas_euryale.AAC.12
MPMSCEQNRGGTWGQWIGRAEQGRAEGERGDSGSAWLSSAGGTWGQGIALPGTRTVPAPRTARTC